MHAGPAELLRDAADHAVSPDALRRANINPVSYLATDYLNHFNEIVMLLEILPSVPELADDVLGWEPRSYREHFEASTFQEKDLAIRAYALADRSARKRLEAVVCGLDRRIVAAQDAVREAIASRQLHLFDPIASLATAELRPLIDEASAVINATAAASAPAGGADHQSAQDAVDALFP